MSHRLLEALTHRIRCELERYPSRPAVLRELFKRWLKAGRLEGMTNETGGCHD